MEGKESDRADFFMLERYQHVADLWRHMREFSRASERAARRHGLTPQRYWLLLMIKGAADGRQVASVGQLTNDLQLAQSSATELIDRAEIANLVRRNAAEHDRRRMEVRLTAEGERRLRAVVDDLAVTRREFADLVAQLKGVI